MLTNNPANSRRMSRDRVGLWLAALSERSKQVLSLLRARPFDSQTPEGRSQERYRRILITTLTSVLVRIVGVVTTLVSVPLTIRYLGVERYGVWMTISSLVAILTFADLGIGNGLLSALANADGRGDRRAARTHVSSAFFLLAGIAVALGGCFAVAYRWVPWSDVLNISSPEALAEAGPALAVLVACFLTNLPLGIVQRIQMGYQQGFTANLWQAFGMVLSLIALLVAIYFEAGLPWLVLSTAGAPIIATVLNGLQMFRGKYRWLRPRRSSFNISAGAAIMRVGFLFFVLQLAGTVGFLSDNLVIAHVLGQEAVAQYSVPAKLFAFAPMILSMALSPLWPAYSEATAAGDVGWVKRTLARSFVLSFAVNTPIAVAFTAFGNPIARLWAGPEIDPSLLLLASLGVWTLLNAMTGPLAMFLNGIGVVRFQVACSTSMAIMNIALSIVLTHYVGVAGVVLGSVISIAICVLIPTFLYLPTFFASMADRRENRELEGVAI